MFMSRQLEKPQKTKFRKQEEVSPKKKKPKKQDNKNRNYDMWEGDHEPGC